MPACVCVERSCPSFFINFLSGQHYSTPCCECWVFFCTSIVSLSSNSQDPHYNGPPQAFQWLFLSFFLLQNTSFSNPQTSTALLHKVWIFSHILVTDLCFSPAQSWRTNICTGEQRTWDRTLEADICNCTNNWEMQLVGSYLKRLSVTEHGNPHKQISLNTPQNGVFAVNHN